MSSTTEEITTARNTVGTLLEALGFANVLYEVERDGEREDHWRVRVECETPKK